MTDLLLVPALSLASISAQPAPAAQPADDPPRLAQPAPIEVKAAADGPAIPEKKPQFGDPGFWTINFGGGVAHDFKDATDVVGVIGVSTFIATSLEFTVEAGGWYFHQDGPDTGGGSGSFAFRYHWFFGDENERTRDWSLFVEAGIGLLGAANEVPDGGTNFDFLPRLGGGGTVRLDDAGTRLLVSLRWHHISNARISGDSDNPSRDGVMIFAGVMVPF